MIASAAPIQPQGNVSPTAASGGVRTGGAVGQVPKHTFALWNRYNVTNAFGVGLGVVHQSSQYAAIRTNATTTLLPAFTRVDAALFYDVNEAVQVQVNVENLLDENYFADAHNNNNITPGAPLNGRLTVRVKF